MNFFWVKTIHGVAVIAFAIVNFFLITFSESFQSAGICFLFAGIALIETARALIPLRNFGPINTLKRYYQNRDKLEEYQKNMYIISSLLLVLGVWKFIKGLWDIITVSILK